MAKDLLNPAQRSAVEHDLGPMLVLAGAGSGKTRVVTQRIARLIDRGVSSRSILAMTFTNKAAAEMHERVEKLVGKQVAKDLTVSTFHRFGLTVLGHETRALGLRGQSFTIFDQADMSGAIREILRHVHASRNYDIGAIIARISAAKNAFIDPEEYADRERERRALDEYDEITAVVYPQYVAALRAFQAFDFDDLLCEVVRLFRRRKDVKERWQERYRYLIVDEYQDTNSAQLELVRLLAEHRNVCVVGDDDQSIYAWRGADVSNILDFESHFPGAKVIKLEENYRSCQPILAVANAILAGSSARRHGKRIVSTRAEGEPVEMIIAADAEVEAAFVGDEIQRILNAGGVRPRDIAVLYRSNQQSTDIEQALKERQIPLRQIGGQQFYERKEVKDLIAYLKVALKPDDELSLRRIINYPSRGIGEAAMTKITNHATAHGLSLWSVVAKPHAVRDLPPAAVEGCRSLVRVVELTRSRFDQRLPSAEIARQVCAEIGMRADIFAGATSNSAAARRWGNVEGMINVFQRRDDQGKGDRDAFADFLRVLALREDSAEEATDRVTLTTMHGAKGLEFRYVFVIGLEDGLMPHQRSLDEQVTDMSGPEGGGHSIDEERRLFYVAVTRARDKLYMSRCKVRAARGKAVARIPSRFLDQIPKELYREREELQSAFPEIKQTTAGVEGVLAALMDPSAAPMPRRRR